MFLSVAYPVNTFGRAAGKLDDVFVNNDYVQRNFPKFNTLTSREKEILQQIGSGTKRDQIADKLYISKHTLDVHRKHIREKLDIHNSCELFRFISAFIFE